MRFLRRHGPDQDMRTDGEPPAALPPVRLSVAAATGGAGEAEASRAGASTELRVRPLPNGPLEPGRGGGRALVARPGARRAVPAAYDRLGAQVVRGLQENGWRSLAITSPSPQPGAARTAINLAVSLAQNTSHNVLLVDLDLARPALGDAMGCGGRPGIVDHLLHDAALPDILFSPGIDGLTVIPAGAPTTRSAELLSSARMARLVELLKQRCDDQVILYYLPPGATSDDAMLFAPLVDCALLVVTEDETRLGDMRRALHDLRATGILGVVLHQAGAA